VSRLTENKTSNCYIEKGLFLNKETGPFYVITSQHEKQICHAELVSAPHLQDRHYTGDQLDYIHNNQVALS
jgi:hypothetical protein